MSDSLSKLEKRTAYTLVLPAVLLVFAIVLFPIFANVWISFKDIELKDIRIPEPRAKKIVKSIPQGKMGSPDDISGMALYLASEASDFVTGSIFTVDGGITT